MVKIIIHGRRRAGLTRAALSRHLREVHGPMVVSPPADAGPMPGGYVQNHVKDGIYPQGSGLERDFVTEVWFDTPEQARASTTTPYYETVLRPDEPRFVALDSVQRCFADERDVRPGQATGHHKAFLFWFGADGFEAAWRTAHAAVSGEPAVLRWVANHTRPMPGPGAAPPDGIDEIWLADGADAQTLFDAMLVQLQGHVDLSGCFFVVVEEFTTARLRADSPPPAAR